MQSQKHSKIWLLTVVGTSFFISCSKDRNSDRLDRNLALQQAKSLAQISFTDEEYTVPIEAAAAIASNIRRLMPDQKMANDGVALTVEKSFTINDDLNKPSLYIFNYKEGGFTVVSADERFNPVLAVVPKGDYEGCKDLNGINMWFEETLENIKLTKDGKTESRSAATARWKDVIRDVSVSLNASGKENNIMAGCSYPTYTTVGVGMTTTWDQGCGYNDSLTTTITGLSSCSTFGCNPNPPTGCVATAMAQVIRFWGAPTSKGYDFTGVPDANASTGGNIVIHRLMRDAGISAAMNYTCGSSGAYMTSARLGFLYTFGYRSVDISSSGSGAINIGVLSSNINNGYPVILGGCSNGSGCHAWVCQGYQKLVSSCYTYYYLSMNWGWGGYGNGTWYEQNNWNSPAGTFSHHQKEMLYNILP